MPRRRPLPFLLLAACCAGGAFAQPAPSAAPPAAASAPGAPASAAAKATPAATAAQGVPTVNPGFESTKTGSRGDPEGWFTFQHAGNPSYRYIVDADNPHGGTRSLRIENIGPEPYGAIAQSFDAKPHVGKVAKLSGWLRTKDANSDGGAGLTLLVQQGGNILAHNFMYDGAVTGTTDWKRYTITVPIPKGADRIEIGAMMRGRGALWFDDAELEFVAP
jgi:hypothetical protein